MTINNKGDNNDSDRDNSGINGSHSAGSGIGSVWAGGVADDDDDEEEDSCIGL